MPKRIRECRCRASPLLRSAVSRIVEVVIRKSRRRLRCLAFQTTGKHSLKYSLGAVKIATNAVGCVVCCGYSHLVLHGLGTTSRVSAGNSWTGLARRLHFFETNTAVPPPPCWTRETNAGVQRHREPVHEVQVKRMDLLLAVGNNLFVAKPTLLRPQRLCNVQTVACWTRFELVYRRKKRKISGYISQDPLSRSYYPISYKNVVVLNAWKCIISKGCWLGIKRKTY